jgi:hypothetical protein
MNNKLTTREIGRLLDQSANELNRATLNELYTARQQAVQRQRSSVTTWMNRDGTLHGHLQLSQRAINWIIALAVATLLAINLTYLDHSSDHDHSDIDIAILTDDLPVDMFVD